MSLSENPSYDELKSLGLQLNLTRGQPSPDLLDTASGLESAYPQDMKLGGKDLRNYAGQLGLEEARALGAGLLRAPHDSIIVGPNSSMSLFHEVLTRAWFLGWNGQTPWKHRKNPKLLFPIPGYDRHVTLFESFGIELVPVGMTGTGVEAQALNLLKEDTGILGMVLVPRHSNPSGDTWSDDVLRQVFEISAERGDILILCDNAYAVHDVRPSPEQTPAYELAEKAGALSSLALSGSTSKLGYAGSGVTFLSLDPAQVATHVKFRGSVTLGPDPLSQARHVTFFKNAEGIRNHFRDHLAPILRTRFDLLESSFAPLQEAHRNSVKLSEPKGGYFYSLWVPDGCASRIVTLARQAGVELTPAGAGWPGGKNPKDNHIRLAPTSGALDLLPTALQVVSASAAKALEESNH